VTEMRIALLCIALALAGGVFITMLVSIRRHRSHAAGVGHEPAVVEYAWAVVPWIIVALFLAQTVYNIIAAG